MNPRGLAAESVRDPSRCCLSVTVAAVAGGAHGAHQEAAVPVRGHDAAEGAGEAVQTSGLGVGAGGRVPRESGQVGGRRGRGGA